MKERKKPIRRQKKAKHEKRKTKKIKQRIRKPTRARKSSIYLPPNTHKKRRKENKRISNFRNKRNNGRRQDQIQRKAKEGGKGNIIKRKKKEEKTARNRGNISIEKAEVVAKLLIACFMGPRFGSYK